MCTGRFKMSVSRWPAGRNSVALLIHSVEEFLADASSTTAVWIDMLSVNQHDETKEHRADIAAFGDVINACSHGTLVVMVGGWVLAGECSMGRAA